MHVLHQELVELMLECMRSTSDLERFVRFNMDFNLDETIGPGNLLERVTELVSMASSQGDNHQIDEILRGLAAEFPTRKDVVPLARKMQAAGLTDVVILDPPPPPPPPKPAPSRPIYASRDRPFPPLPPPPPDSTGEERRRLHDILVKVPRPELNAICEIVLGSNLSVVAGEGPLGDVVFHLVTAVVARDKLGKLVNETLRRYPDLPGLLDLSNHWVQRRVI